MKNQLSSYISLDHDSEIFPKNFTGDIYSLKESEKPSHEANCIYIKELEKKKKELLSTLS